MFFFLDSKNDDQSKKILEQLETIDDDCDRHGIILVKLDNAEEAAQYGQAHHMFSRFLNLRFFHYFFFLQDRSFILRSKMPIQQFIITEKDTLQPSKK